MTCWTSFDSWMASGSIGRTPAAARRGKPLPPLGPVPGAGLLAVAHAGGVERAAHDLVAHARKILDPPAADQDHRVLLEVVPLARDIGGDLHPVGQPHARDLAQRRVRLLGGDRRDPGAHAPALRRRDRLLVALRGLEAGRRDLLLGALAALADQLIDAWHAAADASSEVAFSLWGVPVLTSTAAGRASPCCSSTGSAPPGGCGSPFSTASSSTTTCWRSACRATA